MSEFPTDDLRLLAQHCFRHGPAGGFSTIHRALRAYGQLAERLVMDHTRDSITIGELRAELARREQEDPT